MALSTRTYQELEDLVLARAGATISDNSKARVKALAKANRKRTRRTADG